MVDQVMFSSKKTEWETPIEFFDQLDAEFQFNLDPCASAENAKCKNFFTIHDDGLAQDWTVIKNVRSDDEEEVEGRVFVNPPYGRGVGKWVEKAASEFAQGNAELVVMLLPARTCTKWFHDHVYGKAEIRFIRGRIRFELSGQRLQGAPFPSMLVIWKKGGENIGDV